MPPGYKRSVPLGAPKNYLCKVCNKAYNTFPEYDRHLGQYDHTHRVREKEMREATIAAGKQEEESRKKPKVDEEGATKVSVRINPAMRISETKPGRFKRVAKAVVEDSKTKDKTANDAANKTTNKTVKTPLGKTMKETADETVKGTAKEAVKEAADEAANEAANEVVMEDAYDSKEAADKTVINVADGTAKKTGPEDVQAADEAGKTHVARLGTRIKDSEKDNLFDFRKNLSCAPVNCTCETCELSKAAKAARRAAGLPEITPFPFLFDIMDIFSSDEDDDDDDDDFDLDFNYNYDGADAKNEGEDEDMGEDERERERKNDDEDDDEFEYGDEDEDEDEE